MQSVKEIGYKAYTIGTMREAGISVPDSFFLSCEDCEQFSDLYMRVKTLEASKIIQSFENAGFFEFEKHVEYPVIIRSSSLNEDTEEHSNAGKYLSIYNNYTRIEVINSILKCLKRGEKGKMALIVQSQLFPLYSGVSFIYERENRTEIRIEIAKGLGELLVSGRISPYVFSYDYEKGQPVLLKESRQRIAEFPTVRGTKLQPTDDFEVCGENYRILNIGRNIVYVGFSYECEYWNNLEAIAESVAEAGKKLFEIYGNSDIEWVYTQDARLVIVQRRPITKALLPDCAPNDDGSDSAVGTTIVPGVAKGKLVSLKDYRGEEDCIVYSPIFQPKDIDTVINCRGILSTENAMLSHSSILAREYQIPYWAGFSEKVYESFKNQIVEIDFTEKKIVTTAENLNVSTENEDWMPGEEVNDILTCLLRNDAKVKPHLSARAKTAVKCIYSDKLIDRIMET